MIFMMLFWIVIMLLVLFLVLNKGTRWGGKYSGVIDFLVVFQALLLILALVTHDPVFTSFGIDPLWEITVGILTAGFALWKAYFDPIKKRIGNLETKVEGLDSRLTTRIDGLDKRMELIQSDIQLIKEKLFATK